MQMTTPTTTPTTINNNNHIDHTYRVSTEHIAAVVGTMLKPNSVLTLKEFSDKGYRTTYIGKCVRKDRRILVMVENENCDFIEKKLFSVRDVLTVDNIKVDVKSKNDNPETNNSVNSKNENEITISDKDATNKETTKNLKKANSITCSLCAKPQAQSPFECILQKFTTNTNCDFDPTAKTVYLQLHRWLSDYNRQLTQNSLNCSVIETDFRITMEITLSKLQLSKESLITMREMVVYMLQGLSETINSLKSKGRIKIDRFINAFRCENVLMLTIEKLPLLE